MCYFEYFRIHFGIAPQCLFEAHHYLVRAWMKLLNSIFSLLLLANRIHCMSSQTTNSSIPAKRCACIDQVRHGGAVLISTRLFLRVRSTFPNVSISPTLWQRMLANRISCIADIYFIKQNGQALSHSCLVAVPRTQSGSVFVVYGAVQYVKNSAWREEFEKRKYNFVIFVNCTPSIGFDSFEETTM